MAMALQNLTWGVAQPFTGMIADRHGSAKVIAAGLVFYALGLIGMTLAATPAMFVLTAGICVGIALSGTAFAVIYGALSRLVAPERAAGRWPWPARSADWGSSRWCRRRSG